MQDFKGLRKSYFILLLPAGILLAYASSSFPQLVEDLYAKGLYRFIGQTLSTATGIFPFSAGELIIAMVMVFILGWLIRTGFTLAKGKTGRREIALRFLLNALVLISLIYFGFIILWGLNYYRLPFAEIADLKVRPASVEELAEVCESIIEQANKLRDQVEKDENGVMQIPGGKSDVFDRAPIGYEKAAGIYPELGGRYGKPKGVFLSIAMSYTGISGVYFPFTGEANVNTSIPDAMLPCTATHEMAHQRGFAREDEANYIAYLTCTLHPDPDFQYSGTLLALINAMKMLKDYDLERYEQLRERYGEGVKRDLTDVSAFWQKYEGPVGRVSNDINDLYLKSNRQEDGVYSYNRMVDLLIAEHRANKANNE